MFRTIVHVFIAVGAALLPLSSLRASSGPILFECQNCSQAAIESWLHLWGDGSRYLIDLQGRSMRKFVVSGSPAVPLGSDCDAVPERAPMFDQMQNYITITELPLDGWAANLYQDLQNWYDVNPAYFQNAEATVPMSHPDMGVNPNTGFSFSPFDIWHYGPSNQEWNGFTNRLNQILSSEGWARDVLGDVIATAIFAIRQRLSSAGVQLGPLGGSIGWNPAGPWIVNFCHAGYCLKVRIKPDKTFEFLSATDSVGNAVPQLFGSGWAGGFSIPAQDTAFERLRDLLERRGIPVQGNSCSGWLMLICTYNNGVLSSCYTQVHCD